MQHSKENLFELCLNCYISIKHLDIARVSRKELDIQTTIEGRFTLKRVRAMIITYSYSSVVL